MLLFLSKLARFNPTGYGSRALRVLTVVFDLFVTFFGFVTTRKRQRLYASSAPR
jgi:hypothetical protein